MEDYGEIIQCKCGHKEYDANAYWLNGGPWCRECYKKKYKEVTKEEYRWNDLDNFPVIEDSNGN